MNGANLFWSIKNPMSFKGSLPELIKQTFNREGSLYLTCNKTRALKNNNVCSCHKVWDARHYLLDKNYSNWLPVV